MDCLRTAKSSKSVMVVRKMEADRNRRTEGDAKDVALAELDKLEQRKITYAAGRERIYARKK